MNAMSYATPAQAPPLSRASFVVPQQLRSRSQDSSAQRLAQVQTRVAALRADPASDGALLARAERALHWLTGVHASHKRRPGSTPRRANAKSPDKLYTQVFAHLQQGLAQGFLNFHHSDLVTREAIAARLSVPDHQVEQVFCRLRIEGLLVQQPNEGPHDSYRAHFFTGSSSGWAPTYWKLVHAEKWQALSA